jgi:hypothetical protein
LAEGEGEGRKEDRGVTGKGGRGGREYLSFIEGEREGRKEGLGEGDIKSFGAGGAILSLVFFPKPADERGRRGK